MNDLVQKIADAVHKRLHNSENTVRGALYASIEEAIRQALSAQQWEAAGAPVMWQYRVYHTDPEDSGWGIWHDCHDASTATRLQGDEYFQVRPLYAAAPAVQVPDEWISEIVGGEFDEMTAGQGFRRGWNECRAKMLSMAAALSAQQGVPVMWQYRVYHTDPDDSGWGIWCDCHDASAATRLQGDEKFQVRALYNALPAAAAPVVPVVMKARELADIWLDGQKPSEERSYCDGAFRETMLELCCLLSAPEHAPPGAAARIAELEAQLAKEVEAHDRDGKALYRLNKQLAESREREGRMREALSGLMVGCKRSTIEGINSWHEKQCPGNEALSRAQAVLAAPAPATVDCDSCNGEGRVLSDQPHRCSGYCGRPCEVGDGNLEMVQCDRCGGSGVAPATVATEAVAQDEDIAQAMNFYSVTDLVSLVRIQSDHIERLQKKLPTIQDEQPINPRSGGE